MYLIRKNKARTAHLWDGVDTACRMASTGGLNKNKYRVVGHSDLQICTMCENKTKSGMKPRPTHMQARFDDEQVAQVIRQKAMQRREIRTSIEVWIAMSKTHGEHMVSLYASKSPGRAEYLWTIRGFEHPAIREIVTWNPEIEEPGPLETQHEYWIQVA